MSSMIFEGSIEEQIKSLRDRVTKFKKDVHTEPLNSDDFGNRESMYLVVAPGQNTNKSVDTDKILD